MEQKQIAVIIGAVVVAAVFLGLVYFVKENSGVNPPFTVIESQSMQHSNDSELGIIDTGDMIYVKEPSKTEIVSYVDGSKTGYKTFGDYGSVIIYRVPSGNPIIHRAIVWIEWDEDNDCWNIPSLQDYDPSLWNIDGTHNCTSITLNSKLKMNFQSDYRNLNDVTFTFTESNKHSGYLTLGDNNSGFDQSGKTTLVENERIKSVADAEIPWLGVIKLFVNGKSANVERYASNSIDCLMVFFATIILSIVSIIYIFDSYYLYRINNKLKN